VTSLCCHHSLTNYMIEWKTISSIDTIEEIKEKSHTTPCLIFKHSTRCSISSIAKHRLDSNWNLQQISPYYLDLITFRSISSAISQEFGIDHESPQVLLIENGICIFDTSHLDISVSHIAENIK